MDNFTIQPLGPRTWDAFATLVERHNGVWGGCWCTWFHTMAADKEREATANRALKKRLVEEGRAHAALVFDGDRAVGWCQYGSPAELPNIYHRKEYESTVTRRPDFRITCFFVDRDYRRRGVAQAALRGALTLIARDGGGVVEAYPHQLEEGKRVSASFLYSCTRTMFEEAGFKFDRTKGAKNCVMKKRVSAARTR
ncbi:MAG TPA: GNAT family N-acetyltransferase [Acidimicrobiales bacterium]|nr:GNAT family N-acetyltransferase [Acidimicrobiales bacterium]